MMNIIDNENFYKNFGNKLKDLRKEKGINQKELADYLGLSQAVVCQYEKGTRKIPITVLKKLSDLFKISYDELIINNEKGQSEEERIDYLIAKEIRKHIDITELEFITLDEIDAELIVNVYNLIVKSKNKQPTLINSMNEIVKSLLK